MIIFTPTLLPSQQFSVCHNNNFTTNLRNNPLQRFFAKRFVRLLTGDLSSTPPWYDQVAQGNEPGLYFPDEAPWVVHADLATLVGGIRALLMQALHPGSLTGVLDHSRYNKDPLGRLSGTIRWLTITTFAPHQSLQKEAGRVNKMHQKVQGSYQTASGKSCAYKAADPHLLRWVHIAFMDSFLRCHQNYSTRPLPGGADGYISLWAKSVIPLGLEKAPMSEDELLADLQKYHPELAVTDDTRQVISWIKNPPLPKTSLPAYHFLFKAALATLPSTYQDMINLGKPSLKFYRPTTRNLLRLIRIAIGPESPMEEAAIKRLHRSGLMKDGKVIRPLPDHSSILGT